MAKNRTKTDMIILHCSATQEGKDFHAKDIDNWHKQRGFEQIGYHYVIDLDGTIEKGRPEQMVGAHCTGKNSQSIGICYVGGVDKNNKPKDTRTKEQIESLYKIVNEMMNKYHLTLNQVYPHNAFANKACPCFDMNDFKQGFNRYYSHYVTCPYCGNRIYKIN